MARAHPKLLTLTNGIAVLAALLLVRAPAFAASDRPAPNLNAGQAAYQQSCARCHGDVGKGDGVDAKRFYPQPRDLTLGVYKFRSTASGTPPTDEDLFRTITQGLPGSNMPDWKHLDEATRWQLVAYLKSLSPIFQHTTPEPVVVAADPDSAHVNLIKGRTLYEQLGCAACHGARGRANGTSAGGLMDDWGKRIRPANLTKGWNYRGGSDARSVMLRILTGIDGAGMPSYAGAVSAEDAWPLAYYVASLQEPAHWNLIAHAHYIPGALPTRWDDAQWASAERTDLRVRNVVNSVTGEWVDSPTVNSVAFQALYNDDAIAIRMTWDDPTHDAQSASDRAALLLRPPSAQGDVVTLQAWPYTGAPRLDVCAWSATTNQAVETLASDLEGFWSPGGSHANLQSTSHYDDGRWTLVLQRALHPASPAGGALLGPEQLNAAAFAIWDGNNPNARAVSSWVEVRLAPPRTPAPSRPGTHPK